MTLLLQVTWILPIILASASFCLASLDATYEWKYIDYLWESDDQKANAVADGIYDRTKIIPNDAQPFLDGRVLVTTPKYYDNPASLSTISDQTGEGGPLLAPYPDWSWHNQIDCSGITSVSRVFLDDYNRLWLVDSGKIGNEQVCPAKILAFNATTDELLIEVEIPEELSHNADDKSKGRLEIGPVETTKDSKDKFWVYISDLEGFGLIIWDRINIWRINAAVLNPDPDQTTFTVGGVNITLNLGPASLLLTPDEYLEKPALLFKATSSVLAYATYLEMLHESKSGSNITFYKLNFTAPSQELARIFTKKDATMISGFTGEVIACWSLPNGVLEAANIGYLDTNTTNLQFVSGVKSILNSAGSETVFVITNELQNFVLNTMDWTQNNYRIMTSPVDTLVNGTVCELKEPFAVVESIEDRGWNYFYESSDALYESFPLTV